MKVGSLALGRHLQGKDPFPALRLLRCIWSLVSAYPISVNFLVLLVGVPILLVRHRLPLMNGLDGEYTRVMVLQQRDWMPLGFGLPLWPFQGMANVVFPFNAKLIPAYGLQMLIGGSFDPVFSYTLFILEIFLIGMLFTRLLGETISAQIACGWALIILCFPIPREPSITLMFGIIPHWVDLLLGSALFLAGLAVIGSGSRLQNLIGAAGVALIPTFLIVQNPLLVIIIAPATGVLALTILISSKTCRPLSLRIGAILLSVTILVVSGAIEFLVGNILYSTPTFFADELLHENAIFSMISILFQQAAVGWGGPALFICAMISASYFAYFSYGLRRAFAIASLVLAFFIVGGGYAMTLSSKWRGPAMFYFETPVWPLYTALTISLLFVILRRVAYFSRSYYYPLFGGENILPPIIALLGAMALIVGIKSPSSADAFPPARTAIVRTLEQAVSLKPGAVFRGYVSTITGASEPSGTNWYELAYYDWAVLVPSTRNDHRFIGLWAFGIPTLQEYNQFTTPTSYLYLSRLLARPIDQQIRSITILTLANLEKLQSLGVAYIISDTELPIAEIERIELPVNNPPLRLYRLPKPNLGQYSPTHSIIVRNANEALSAIESVDLESSVITDQSLPPDLTIARDVTLRFFAGIAEVRASSDGAQSVIVLPIQYSRCLRAQGRPANMRLFRANLMQTGVLFSGQLEIDVELTNDPIRNRRCRLNALFEMQAFGLSEAARNRPIGK